MSADIWLVDPACESCGRSEDYNESYNLTYNLSPMLWAAGMPPWKEFVGLSGADAGPKWRATYDALVADPERFQAMNPENGWGTYDQAVKMIGELADACEQRPKLRVEAWL